MNSSATDTMWMSVAIAVIVLAMVLMIVIVSLVVYIFKKQKEKSQPTEPAVIDEWNEPFCLKQDVAGMKGSQTKSIQLEEWQWIRSTRVDVTLNAASANPYLTLGKNGRQVGWRQTRQTHEESPARFDEYPCVLGEMKDFVRRRYWEVEVGEKKYWEVGVARESVRRQGQFTLNPHSGFWVLSLWEGTKFKALTDPETPLVGTSVPRKLGVYLDYDKKQVSFYNAEVHSLIYTFEESFDGEVCPFFSPGCIDEDPLIISPVS